MGRFASTVEFYARFREPYSSAFFRKVADEMGWRGTERLLDVGCGPGLLTYGFAPYIAEAVGIDIEPGMLDEARALATDQQSNVSFVQSRLEDFETSAKFEIVTIGRALHWLDRKAALPKLEELASEDGVVLECGASTLTGELSPWLAAYNDTRRKWVSEDEGITRGNRAGWFAGSTFHEKQSISVKEPRPVTADELVWRALSRSNTSPQMLGARRPQFEAELRDALAPFTARGALREEIVSRATVFARHTPR